MHKECAPGWQPIPWPVVGAAPHLMIDELSRVRNGGDVGPAGMRSESAFLDRLFVVSGWQVELLLREVILVRAGGQLAPFCS